MNTLIRLLYSVLIAAAVVAFVAIGIYTFYPAPTAPTYPMMPMAAKSTDIAQPIGTPAPEAEQLYQTQLSNYQNDLKAYQRNVSIILVVASAAIVGLGLWLRSRSDIIGEGLSLGGIGTSIYAIGTAVAADDRIMRFVAVSLFLASVLVVVYFKFNNTSPKKAAKKR